MKSVSCDGFQPGLWPIFVWVCLPQRTTTTKWAIWDLNSFFEICLFYLNWVIELPVSTTTSLHFWSNFTAAIHPSNLYISLSCARSQENGANPGMHQAKGKLQYFTRVAREHHIHTFRQFRCFRVSRSLLLSTAINFPREADCDTWIIGVCRLVLF